MTHRIQRTLVPLLVLLVVGLTGCRTYGGYDTEAVTLAQIERANELFSEELDRASAELSQLAQAADGRNDLDPFLTDYESALELHREMVVKNAELAEQASASPNDYRVLNRAYGAIISQQAMVSDRYNSIYDDLLIAEGKLADEDVPDRSRYQIVPQHYERLARSLRQRSIRTVVSE